MIDTTGLSDVQVLACTLYGEARSEPLEGIIAVACVIRNRAQDTKGRWGKSIRDVCLQPKQFSCWNDGPLTTEKDGKTIHTNHGRLSTLVADLKAGVAPDDRFKECAWVATGVVNNWNRDTVKGANHYHTASLIPRPAWAQEHAPIIQVKSHVFYAF